MKLRCTAVALPLLLVASQAFTQKAQPAQPSALVAVTPPMGWNSWDAYGLTITEEQFRGNVTVLAKELKPLGWNYAVIDEGWFFFNPQDRQRPNTLHYAIDANGRYVPVPERFPSVGTMSADAPAAAGADAPKLAATIGETSFKPLADFVHAQGLKFGIHIVRGIPRAAVERSLPIADSSFKVTDAADTADACPWDPTNWGVKDNAAGQAWYDSLLKQYAGWGVDLLKVDCISNNPYKVDEIRMIRRAIDKTHRPIVLSLSPGPTNLSHAEEVGSLSHMWRISNDIWDYWTNTRGFPIAVSSQFARLATWAKYAKPGNWPDADMLPLGELRPSPGDGRARTTRLTPDEQQTLMTLWSIGRSPLVLGANLTLLDDATRKLLTAPGVLRIDQAATASREALHNGSTIAWTADLPAKLPASLPPALRPAKHSDADGATKALALFNTGDTPITITNSFSAYGLDDAAWKITDAWTGKSLGRMKSVDNLMLQPHSSVLWLLKK